jgi:hypothetical protein
VQARIAAVGLVAAVLTAPACKRPTAAGESAAPTTLDQAQQRLAANADALAAEGIAVPSGEAARVTEDEDDLGDAQFGQDAEAEEASPPAPDEPAVTSQRREDRRVTVHKARTRTQTRCERVCGLAESTCELQLQICELAERHATDTRYADACDRAALQCDAAAAECHRCED